MRTNSASDRFAMSTRTASTFIPTRCWPISICRGSIGGAGLIEATSKVTGGTAGAVLCANSEAAKNKATKHAAIWNVEVFWIIYMYLWLSDSIVRHVLSVNPTEPNLNASSVSNSQL